ncbi:MAG: hypothetical protein WCK01_05605 [Candidatus Uhrbacteria bacterium]
MELSSAKVALLAKAVQPRSIPEVPESSRITVHAAVSRFSVLYEKIRNAVDYREEHLLHKAAIKRILKRQLALDGDPQSVGRALVRELIAARYLPNGVLPESLGDRAADIVAKYVAVQRLHVGDEKHESWLIGVISAELEELLDDHAADKVFVHFFYEQLAERITLPPDVMGDDDRRLQIYIAAYRMFLKADDEIIGYKLLRAFRPDWVDPLVWIGAPGAMALDLPDVQRRVHEALHHPLALKFQHAVKPWAISLNILRTALMENPAKAAELMAKPDALHGAIDRIAEKRVKESKTRLRRGTIRAMIYLFMTKMLIALMLEVPIELLLYHEFRQFSLVVNILFPPLMMLFIGSMIRLPGKDNIKRIVSGVEELLSEHGPKGREVRPTKKRGFLGRSIFALAYMLTFLLVFSVTFMGLKELAFTWVSSLIFVFFLCVVSFFAFRLRYTSREYVAVPRPDNLLTILIDFVSLPVLRAGRFLSEGLSRINVFVFFFDFIFEAPFKLFLNILEEWSAFMKEKKEQLQ